MGTAMTSLGGFGGIPTALGQSVSNGIELPELGKDWKVEEVNGEASRFDWQGVVSEMTDLRDSASEYAGTPPTLVSFIAIQATPTEMIEAEEEDTSTKITIGGGPIPFSFTVDKPEYYLKKKTCGIDPHVDTVTKFLQDLFIEQTRRLHLFEGEVSFNKGLRKGMSPACIREFAYDKSKYIDMGYTTEAEWEAASKDELEDIAFRGLLSIERWREEYLLVGGMVPDEKVTTGILGGDTIVEDETVLQKDLISKMENTGISTV